MRLFNSRSLFLSTITSGILFLLAVQSAAAPVQLQIRESSTKSLQIRPRTNYAARAAAEALLPRIVTGEKDPTPKDAAETPAEMRELEASERLQRTQAWVQAQKGVSYKKVYPGRGTDASHIPTTSHDKFANPNPPQWIKTARRQGRLMPPSRRPWRRVTAAKGPEEQGTNGKNTQPGPAESGKRPEPKKADPLPPVSPPFSGTDGKGSSQTPQTDPPENGKKPEPKRSNSISSASPGRAQNLEPGSNGPGKGGVVQSTQPEPPEPKGSNSASPASGSSGSAPNLEPGSNGPGKGSVQSPQPAPEPPRSNPVSPQAGRPQNQEPGSNGPATGGRQSPQPGPPESAKRPEPKRSDSMSSLSSEKTLVG
ncbi:hypothetical protein CC1G_05839 [Coprinopsis cinerea okayama7|uniref:Uncharacterized protein n=1 Tax=Coprinopsis cinerea (strain Okayama-7 / 130 / ATCC MYA-4618 / FGSC 9003) TaxID=240176 RepID=A8NLJ4_COPC7|nr:hypothetical protein CC1G_05839 [Coprinopsis cinerea okayama7\|eukprot:XP_001834702.1 hypothetical protein CC1G_05839 [Coprinopsis cinerea okayama7\